VFGKLTWDAVPWSQPIPLVAGGVVILAVLAVVLWVIIRGYLPYLWNEWITSVDHKRIGVMYLLLALLMLLRGFIDAPQVICRPSISIRSARQRWLAANTPAGGPA
jgi:cytochrome o ubiquinol oxidase subunit 1